MQDQRSDTSLVSKHFCILVDNLQSIKHRTQIMKEKYFYILAYKHETDYKGLSHRWKVWPDNRAIHIRTDQPGANKQRICSLELEIPRTVDLYKMVICWFI